MIALEMISEISKHLTLQIKTRMVMPFLSDLLAEERTHRSNNGSNSRVQVKTIEVLLNLFSEFEASDNYTAEAEPLDYKFVSFIILRDFQTLARSN
jgi:hypothetical protein